MKYSFALMLALACSVSQQASAHGGGLNSEGCHNNRKTGDYHCHRAPAARPALAVAAQVEADRVSVPRPAAADTRRPQCFTGPRGGTYTITASGHKNYSGC
jgi:hypothetical protein